MMFDEIKKDGIKVVDLGVGEGPVPHIICDQGYDVTGVDNMRIDHSFKTSLVQMILEMPSNFLQILRKNQLMCLPTVAR